MILKPMLMKTQMLVRTFVLKRVHQTRPLERVISDKVDYYLKICLGEIHINICYILHKCLVNGWS